MTRTITSLTLSPIICLRWIQLKRYNEVVLMRFTMRSDVVCFIMSLYQHYQRPVGINVTVSFTLLQIYEGGGKECFFTNTL